MKNIIKFFIPITIFLPMLALAQESVETTPTPPPPPAKENDMSDVSYVIGLDVGKGMRLQEVNLIPDKFFEGLKAGLSGENAKFTDQEAREIMLSFQEEFKQKQQVKQDAKGKENKSKGDEFLTGNGKKEGVTTTESGLQYEVIQAGEGPKPETESQVSVHYTGTLIDGTVFDSSVERGQPASFKLNQVIPGWTEGLQLMSPGSKYRFVIPSELAYGERAPPKIGPNQVLIFEVELLSVE